MIRRRAIGIAALCLIVGACGGGGGGHSAPPDTTPETFTFASAKDREPNVAVESAAVVIAGIDAQAQIAVVGGEYAIDGGSFTSAAGTVSIGQRVRVRVTTPSDFARTAAATLTIGGVGGTFSVTTRLPDIVPDNFSFTAAPNEVTTSADVTPPAVTVLFPPRQTRTGGATVVLRGTASDDSGALKLLRVNGVPAATSDGYAHWTATVPLAIGNNSVVIDAEDMFLNANPNAAQLAVRRHPRFVLPYSAAVDAANGRVLVVDAATASLVTVDLATGARSVFSTRGTPDLNQPFQLPYTVGLDTARNRALVYDASRPAVLAVDLASGVRSVLSDANTPNASTPFANGRDIVLDAARNRLLVLTSAPSIIAVDLDTGARTLLSDATTPDTSNPFATPWAIAVSLGAPFLYGTTVTGTVES